MDWVKIMCNILDHRKIKMIRKGPEGNTLVLLWLLMLTEAGKCNRGGYLMISDSLPFSAETLSMATDIPLPTVQLGLSILTGLSMIDQNDGAIYIRNWGKYQSEDKLEARRENDRERKQRQRQKERDKILLPPQIEMSRESHTCMSREVTPENREDNREEKTTEHVRLLLKGTPLSGVTDSELHALVKRHGFERLSKAADVAAETWRRNREEKHNPGGYLHSLCTSLVMPEWYVPFTVRMANVQASQQRKMEEATEDAELKAREEAQAKLRNDLWESLAEEQRDNYLSEAQLDLPTDLDLPVAVAAIAKLLAWEANQDTRCP